VNLERMTDRLSVPDFLAPNNLVRVTGPEGFFFSVFLHPCRHFLSTVNTLAIPAIM
jgi:hypothetical protein